MFGQNVRFRPAKVLRRLHDEEGKSYAELERLIRECAEKVQGKRIDRRKLKDLVDLLDPECQIKDVSLSLRELVALDKFLTPYREGLADQPLFEKLSALREFLQSGHVSLALGTRPRGLESRTEISIWDVRAMGQILGSIEVLKPGTGCAIHDLRSGTERERSMPPFLEKPDESVCCIGSPRVSDTAEFMLARMLDVQPFDPAAEERPPLQFVWPRDFRRPSSSTFRADPATIRKLNEKLAMDLEKDRARGVLRVYDQLFPVHQKQGKGAGVTYGIVVTQRRGGKVWVVLAGVSGPATYGCAAAFAAERTGTVPDEDEGRSPARWDVVKCRVINDPLAFGDQRKVESFDVVAHGWF